ncbi:MAG TPA: endonuclease/exonuclease/phosphatase family protein [Cryptosporangiaceae bacterium]|nr:endonuclease/exonuclease/phosphatase family protein [Cryptosporangiaceae bacterium]
MGLLVLWGLLAGLAALVAVRLTGYDTVTPLAQVVAYTPYGGLLAVLTAGVALAFRQWRAGIVAVLLVVAMAVFLVPRMAGSVQPGDGTPLRVMTLNLLVGAADPGAVVDLVRRTRPDVVTLLELTEPSVAALDAAGLASLLPHRALRPGPKASGTGIYARYPILDSGGFDARSTFDQTRARVQTPGGDVDVVAAHPAPPLPGPALARWERDLRLFGPPPTHGPPLVLAGDFNASLDHSLFRRLVDLGYVDAAAAVGAGLVPTWPWDGSWLPPVTLDHVLTDGRAIVRDFEAHEVPGTDHRAVVADLRLP